jgi:sarcosine oxidase subunit gamma
MADAGVTLRRAEARPMAGVAAFAGAGDVPGALAQAFGVAPPARPGCVQGLGVAISCVGAGRWLVAGGEADLASRLRTLLGGQAAVTDQSDMWDVTCLHGPSVREALARCVQVDLHPSRFGAGDVALTRAGHLDVILWCVADAAVGERFEIAVWRSYAGSLHHALHAAAGAFGVHVAD